MKIMFKHQKNVLSGYLYEDNVPHLYLFTEHSLLSGLIAIIAHEKCPDHSLFVCLLINLTAYTSHIVSRGIGCSYPSIFLYVL